MTPHPVDRRPRIGELILGAIQHVGAMYAGVVAPPLVIGAAVGLGPAQLSLLIGASLFTSGIATLLQTLGLWRFGARLPLVNGITFASVAPVQAIAAEHAGPGALSYIYGATLFGGVLIVLLSPLFSRLLRFFPPLVTGTVITLIGVSLMPVTAEWIADQKPTGNGRDLLLAGFTLVVVLLCNRFLTGVAGQFGLLIGLLAGTLLAWPLGAIDTSTFSQAKPFGITTPFHFGTPVFDLAAIIALGIAALVTMAESTADMIALGEVVERPTDQRTLADGLRADGLASAVSTVFGGFMATAFAQNIGVVALTKVRSRFVVAGSGVVLVLLGMFPIAGGVVALVPQPVLGGAGLVLFGSVAVAGIRTLTRADLSDSTNVVIVAASLGMGLLPVVAPQFYAHFPSAVRTIMNSGISAGCLTAVILNLLFGKRNRKAEAEEKTRPAPPLSRAVDEEPQIPTQPRPRNPTNT